MMRLALFASGGGTNAQAIIDAVDQGQLEAEIVCLFCDQPSAYVIERAEWHQIPTLVLRPKDCASRQAWEEEILAFLQSHQVDLIACAGFMRIIGETLLSAYPQQIVNIHPALLPSFPGRDGIGDAYDYGVKITGVTIHWVDSGIDTGQIIAQEAVRIEDGWSQDELATAIHKIEHQLYPATLQLLAQSFKEEL